MSGGRGYAVALLRDVHFGPDIVQYLERIEGTFEPFGGEWVVHGARLDIVEGAGLGDLVIIGFPSLDDAHDWYRSAAYREILDLRTSHSASTVFLVEGVSSGYSAAETIGKLVAGGLPA
ncbi:MAG: DUF1330 domain-containing protein [Pseudoclavibacter sp.]